MNFSRIKTYFQKFRNLPQGMLIGCIIIPSYLRNVQCLFNFIYGAYYIRRILLIKTMNKVTCNML